MKILQPASAPPAQAPRERNVYEPPLWELVRPKEWLSYTCWGYLGVLLLATLIYRFLCDQVWWTVPLGFGPRWVSLLGVPPLAVLVLLFRRRALLWVVCAIVGTWFLGIDPPNLPLRKWTSGEVPPGIRVVTFNLGGVRANLPLLHNWLDEIKPDLALFQECPSPREMQPVFAGLGWNVERHGGMVIASRFPITPFVRLGWKELHEEASGSVPGGLLGCRVQGPDGPFDIFNVHLPTPRGALDALRSTAAANVGAQNLALRRAMAANFFDRSFSLDPLIIAGDFNTTRESVIYADYWSRYRNAFDWAGFGWGATKFTDWHSVRIDHVLSSPQHWRIGSCLVGPDLGSDHRPVIADFQQMAAATQPPPEMYEHLYDPEEAPKRESMTHETRPVGETPLDPLLAPGETGGSGLSPELERLLGPEVSADASKDSPMDPAKKRQRTRDLLNDTPSRYDASPELERLLTEPPGSTRNTNDNQ